MTMQPWERPTPLQQGRDIIDGWAAQIAHVAKLAEYISQTEFVPREYANQPAAVAAAILAGRELGVGPMTALQHLHVIKGRPAMSAQLMRALVHAHGHHLRVTEKTSARVTMVGRRLGEQDEQTVSWTLDDARAAGLLGNPAWKAYPRAMLLARATAELCRDKFPDVIGGMAYATEEAADMDAAAETPPSRTTRTVRRAPTVEGAAVPPPLQPGPSPVPAPPGPPPLAPAGAGAPPLPGMVEADRDHSVHDGKAKRSTAQLATLFGLLTQLELAIPREKRIEVASALTGRRIDSFRQLTRDEASAIIDTLTRVVEEAITRDDFNLLIARELVRLDEATQ